MQIFAVVLNRSFRTPERLLFYIKRQKSFFFSQGIFTIYYMRILGVTKGYRGLQGVTQGYKRVTRGYRQLKGLTGGYKGLQGLQGLTIHAYIV